MCREGLGSFLKELDLADEVIEIKKNDKKSYSEAILKLRSFEFENIFSPHESFRTAWTVSKLRAQRTFGFKRWWNGWAFTNRVVRPLGLPEVLRQMALLQSISNEVYTFFSTPKNTLDFQSKNGQSSTPIPDWLSMKKNFAEKPPAQLKNVSTKRVVIAPGSQWSTKRWTIEGFSSLGQSFRKHGYEVVIVGAESEKEICDRVAKGIDGSQNLCGKTTLYELLSLLKTSTCLIVNDSGVMHMASVAGLPSVAIFGPTTLELGYRPWQNHAKVIEKNLSCRPCGKHGHQTCPIGTHECMKSISSSEVIEAAHSLTRS